MSHQLTELGFETAEISMPKGKKLVVRGIAFNDVLKLVRIHGPDLVALWDRIQSGGDKIDVNDFGAMAVAIFDQAPDVVADLILYACDLGDGKKLSGDEVTAAHAVAARLPAPVQLKALEKIGELTFGDDGVGEFMETVIRVSGGVRKLLDGLRASKSGSAVSESSSPS